jgi:hypothetical protein
MIFIDNLLDNAIQVIRRQPVVPGCYLIGVGKQHSRRWPSSTGSMSEFFTGSTTTDRPRRSIFHGLDLDTPERVPEFFTPPTGPIQP